MHLKHFGSLLMLFLLLNAMRAMPVSLGQTAEDKGQKELAPSILTGEGLSLLDEVIAEAQGLRLPENRALAQAAVADLLWAHNEQRARALFGEALNSIEAINGGAAPDETEDEALEQLSVDLRHEVLEKIAGHDLAWARELLHHNSRTAQQPDEELQMDLNRALQLAAQEPEQAVRIASESLALGLSEQLPDLVLQLKSKHPQAAARLMRTVVSTLRAQDLGNNEKAAAVAVSLLRANATEPSTGASGSLVQKPAPERTSEQELAEMIVSAALGNSARSMELLFALQPSLKEIERYAPARAPLLLSRLARLSPLAGEPAHAQANVTTEDGTGADLLREAAKAPPEMSDALYQEAAAKASSEGDRTRALELIAHIADQGQRRELLVEMHQSDLLREAQAGETERVLASLVELRTPEERIALLVSLATAIAKRNEQKRAIQLLIQAQELLGAGAHNFAQLNARLHIALVFARLDPARGLEIIQAVVAQLNEVANAAVLVDGFIMEGPLVRNDELSLRSLSPLMHDLLGGSDADVPFLLRHQFDMMKGSADSFQRPELRILAYLYLAQNILNTKEEAGARLPGRSARRSASLNIYG